MRARFTVAIAFAVASLASFIFAACGSTTFVGDGADATTAVDASGTDSNVLADGSDGVDGGSPCRGPGAGTHDLCDDFDDPVLSPFWTIDPSCGAAAQSNLSFLSPPNSLLAENAPDVGCAYLDRQVGVNPGSHLTCSFDVKLGAPLPSFYHGIFSAILSAKDAKYYEIDLAFQGVKAFIGEDARWTDAGSTFGDTGLVISDDAANGDWVHATFEVDLVAGTASASLGGPVAVRTLQSYSPSGSAPSSSIFSVRAGVSFNPPDAGVVSANYDNVVCDLR